MDCTQYANEKLIYDRKNRLADALRKIPPEVWSEIVKKGPEWYELKPLRHKFNDGAFSVFMLTVGLNAYQLKGRAEMNYFPQLSECLEGFDSVTHIETLYDCLGAFYKKERLHATKVERLAQFLQSHLAKRLWTQSIQEIATSIDRIWHSLGNVMGQKLHEKTICFAMKCLGISFMMSGVNNFDFDFSPPIPVDSRVCKFTNSLGLDFGEKNRPIQCYWGDILSRLRSTLPQITIIHLDSLIWQIAHLDEYELRSYLKELGIDENIFSILCFG